MGQFSLPLLKMRRTVPVILLAFLLPLFAVAQSAVRFPLERHGDGHYYFNADVCGQQAEIMLESGIPALLIGRDFYERNMKGGELKFQPSTSRMRLMNNVYQISFRAAGKVQVGGAVYDGPIFILERFGGISLPVQHLKDRQSGKRIVTVDLNDLYMSVGGPAPSKGEKYKLALDKQTSRPYISSYFFIDGHEFDGRLLVVA